MAKPSGFSSGFGSGFGVGKYHYRLTPYVWDTTGPFPRWRYPDSCVGGVDLRPLAAQSTAGGAPQGFGFAVALQPISGNAIAHSLHFGQEPVTPLMQDTWEAATGFRPNGTNLVDLLWDQLTTGSDPAGEEGPKPLMPGSDNLLKLYVGGHSLVRGERFRWGVHPHTGKVREVLWRDFRACFEAAQAQRLKDDKHHQRVLDHWCRRYQVDEWREFVPADLRPHVPGREPSATTVSDDFNRADNDSLGASWTETNGDLDIVDNKCRVGGTGVFAEGRYESDLSSDDQVVTADVTSLPDSAYQWMAARFHASARTFYLGGNRRRSSAPEGVIIAKMVAGTYTQLNSDTASCPAPPFVGELTADGSTISYTDGTNSPSLSDTAITGHLRAGIVLIGSGPSPDATVDNWMAQDVGGAPAPKLGRGHLVSTKLERRQLVG